MNETVKQILDMIGADDKLKKSFFDILNGNSTDKVGALVNLFKKVGKNVSADDVKKVMEAAKSLPINSDVLNALKQDTELTNEVTAKVYTLIDLVGSFPDAANSSPAEPAANEEISDVLKKTYFQGMTEGKFASAQEAADQFWAEAQEIWAKY